MADDAQQDEPKTDPDAQQTSDAKDLQKHHDRFVRALLSNPERAAAFLHDHLPKNIANRLDDKPPVAMEGSFIDQNLRLNQSDQLFQVHLKDNTQAFVYALIEHKSYCDPALPLQLATYQIRIWQQYAQNKASRLCALPPILPIVIYHGAQKWSAPPSLYDMIAGDDELRTYANRFSYHLRDLGNLDLEQLSNHDELQAGLLALVYAFKKGDIEQVLVSILQAMRDGSVLEKQLVQYIHHAYNIQPETMLNAAKRAKPERWEALVGSLADTLIKQGREEGKAEGRAEGLRASLKRFLVHRFGTLPAAHQVRIEAATITELDRWIDRAFNAANLDAVFGDTDSR